MWCKSWIFSIITPFFSVTWSFRNHLCWFAAQETFLIFKMLCCLIFFFCGNSDMFFRILWWIERTKTAFTWNINLFCNIINVFTVIFDQIKASLLNTRRKKKIFWLKVSILIRWRKDYRRQEVFCIISFLIDFLHNSFLFFIFWSWAIQQNTLHSYK